MKDQSFKICSEYKLKINRISSQNEIKKTSINDFISQIESNIEHIIVDYQNHNKKNDFVSLYYNFNEKMNTILENNNNNMTYEDFIYSLQSIYESKIWNNKDYKDYYIQKIEILRDNLKEKINEKETLKNTLKNKFSNIDNNELVVYAVPSSNLLNYNNELLSIINLTNNFKSIISEKEMQIREQISHFNNIVKLNKINIPFKKIKKISFIGKYLDIEQDKPKIEEDSFSSFDNSDLDDNHIQEIELDFNNTNMNKSNLSNSMTKNLKLNFSYISDFHNKSKVIIRKISNANNTISSDKEPNLKNNTEIQNLFLKHKDLKNLILLKKHKKDELELRVSQLKKKLINLKASFKVSEMKIHKLEKANTEKAIFYDKINHC